VLGVFGGGLVLKIDYSIFKVTADYNLVLFFEQ